MTKRARSLGKHASRRLVEAAVCGLVFPFSASVLAATGQGDLTDANIRYVGRWDRSDSTKFTSYWGGAYLTTKFTGRTVKVEVAAQTSFQATIDGVTTKYDYVSGQVDLTPTPLADGTHTLVIATRHESHELPFRRLILGAGASTVAPPARPLVEFIGDSITAGVGSSNGSVTDHAWLAGERLGADHTQIAYGGISLVDGYHYDWNQWPGMDAAYFKLKSVNNCKDPACADNPAWDFSKSQARAVVVNLGTNDANLSVSSATFQSRYTAFLKNIRARHPNADIFAMRTLRGYYAAETRAAVDARVREGDAKVHFIDTDGWLDSAYPSPDYSDYVHPSDAGYVKVTNRLVPVLLPYMGVATVNDAQFGYDNTASWGAGWQAGTYQNDNRWSAIPGASYQVPFTGTRIDLYGSRAPWHGIAAVSIDGGAETDVDFYAAAREDGVPLWSSPVLPAGKHTLKVRVTGRSNTSATGTFITADRADIVDGGVNLLSNAGFEDGLTGWSVVSSAASQAYANNTQPRSGGSQLTHAGSTGYWVATFQTFTGLPNGQYTVKAWVRGTAGHTLYVKNFGGTGSLDATVPASDAYTQLVINNINVTNGSAEVGFWTYDASGKAWLSVDDMTFYKQ